MNLIAAAKTAELTNLSKELGFSKTLFLEDFVIIKSTTKKDLLNKIKQAKKQNKLTVFRPQSEDLLRFALEKTQIDIIASQELINPKDSPHFVRGALDQITCKLAAKKGKTIVFSFVDILEAKNRAQLLSRMMFNLKLCKKYKIKTLFTSFATNKHELRSKKDLAAFQRVLQSSKQFK